MAASAKPDRTGDKRLMGGHRAALAAALGFGLLTPLLSLEPFGIGFWDRVEPTIVWLHLGVALTALTLLCALHRNSLADVAMLHPFVVVPAALGVWSAATAPLAQFPWAALLGPPQSGEGALWYLDLAVLTAVGILAFRDAALRPALIAVAGLVGMATAACVLLSPWLPLLTLLPVPHFYGFGALALLFLGGASWAEARSAAYCAWAGALALLAAAGSAAGWSLAGAVACGAVLYRRLPPGSALRAQLSGRTIGVAIVATAALLPVLLIRCVPALADIRSLRSRDLIWDIMADPEIWTSGTLAVGRGWGHTQETFAIYLNAAGTRLWQTDWDFLWRDIFHSHNQLIEALHAAGLPGAILSFGLLAMVPLWAPPARRFPATLFAASVGTMAAVWPQLPPTLPVMALATAAVADLSPSSRRVPPALRMGGFAALAGVIFLSLYSAAVLWREGVDVSGYRHALRSPASGTAASVPRPPPTDRRGQGLALAASFRVLTDDLRTPAAHSTAGNRATARAAYLGVKSRMRGASLLVRLAGIAFLSDVFFTGDLGWLARDYAGEEVTWRRWVGGALAAAPGRGDVAIPWLGMLLRDGRHEELAAFLGWRLRRAPDDPVALFYAGALTTTLPGPAEKTMGLRMIRAAVDRGIERFMPLDGWLRRIARRLMPAPDPLAALEAAWPAAGPPGDPWR